MSTPMKLQLRNRDAAMRSKERKKMYVKDLEMKSRYMEADCRRLGRLLQCCYAENQMLRISFGGAYGATMTKPESAVLLLESLLLVSLIWLMVNICLLPLPKLSLLNQGAVPHGSVERKEQESAAPKGKGTKVTELWVTHFFMRSKRCRAYCYIVFGGLIAGIIVFGGLIAPTVQFVFQACHEDNDGSVIIRNFKQRSSKYRTYSSCLIATKTC